MATRFVQQAEQQVNPLFQQQIQAQQAQIPAIQQLYQTLTQGLQQQAQRELQTGTQSILEDASRRGVLRSTLPVDARTELQAAISQGLIGRMGELGLQQARDISGIQSNIANLGIERLRTITSLADALQAQDLRERQFAMEQAAARQRAAQEAAANRAAAVNFVRNKAGGFELYNADGTKSNLDLWQFVQLQGGGVSELVSLLSEGDEQDRAAAQKYMARIEQGVNPSAAFEQLKRDRPTAFYRS